MNMDEEATGGASAVAGLISRAAVHAGRCMSSRVGTVGLSIPSYGVLVALHERRIASRRFLRDLLDIDKNAMVGLVDDLEERGWVRRGRRLTDRRVHTLSLTDRGREFVTGELLDLLDDIDDTLSAQLTEPDRERLCGILEQVIRHRLAQVPGLNERYVMIKISGPDFIGLQVRDVPAAADFYENVIGLTRAPMEVPGATIFATEPIPFAVREAAVDLDAVERLGWVAKMVAPGTSMGARVRPMTFS